MDMELLERMKQLEQLSNPLAEHLRKEYHPHTAVIVTDEQAVVVETVLSVPLKENS